MAVDEGRPGGRYAQIDRQIWVDAGSSRGGMCLPLPRLRALQLTPDRWH